MGTARNSKRGFTLIAALMILLLLSGMSIGLLYMVTGSSRISGNDMETNQAYYAAQSGMEQMTTDVASLYQANLNPLQSNLNSMATTSSGKSAAMFSGTSFVESATLNGATTSNIISQGNDAGLTAELVPITMKVTAIRPSGAAVSMTRGVEAAIIPVFQFGVFSQSDLSYFAGPPFYFQGRVHTNGNLFLAANSGPLVFGSKVTAVGQIIRDQLANGYSGSDYKGSVYVPNQTGGCDSYIAAGASGSVPSNCIDVGTDSNKSENDASWSGGYPTGGQANTNWKSRSTGEFNSMLGNATSIGVTALNLPFVQSNTSGQAADPIEIIREPLSTESPSSPEGGSREFNKANIRILLADTEAELHPTGTANDSADVHLDGGSLTLNSGSTAYFAQANNTVGAFTPNGGSGTSTSPYLMYSQVTDPAWVTVNTAATPPTIAGFAPNCGGTNSDPGAATPVCNAITTNSNPNTWPLVNGWLRVEYLGNDGNWHGVTNEWLAYGFAKDPYIARTSPGVDTVGHKDAILILQQIADRDGDAAITNKTVTSSLLGTSTTTGTCSTRHCVPPTTYYNYYYQYTESTASTGAGTSTNFYPINFYDAREGFPRDSTTLTGTNGYTNGVMSAVELDVGNLARWIAATGDYAGSSGGSINATPQNGYLVYFSDRRGMVANPNAKDDNGNAISPIAPNGESGLEDVINASSSTGTPDQALETAYLTSQSPEDVDNNGLLDNWGSADMGYGWYSSGLSNTHNPYQSVDCFNAARQNWVSGARRVLKLVDGSLGNLPTPGFTVAAENPVYIQGNYNSNSGDTVWNSTPVDVAHSAASVVADAVTLLSSSWSDFNSMKNPSTLSARTRTDTYYRVAIAGGKNMTFKRSTVAGSGVPEDFGTDGGVHNFLRMLETGGNVYYRGSLVSLYYSEYATGTFKCCSLVYGAPGRHFSFDTDFLTPSNLPPGTPELQDVVNLSYWQSFTPCTTQSNGNCTN